MTREVCKRLTATTDRPGPSGTKSRGVKRFLSERELEEVIEEIYDNEGSEVDWSDSDGEQEEASVPINMSSDSGLVTQNFEQGLTKVVVIFRVVFMAILKVVLCKDRE